MRRATSGSPIAEGTMLDALPSSEKALSRPERLGRSLAIDDLGMDCSSLPKASTPAPARA